MFSFVFSYFSRRLGAACGCHHLGVVFVCRGVTFICLRTIAKYIRYIK